MDRRHFMRLGSFFVVASATGVHARDGDPHETGRGDRHDDRPDDRRGGPRGRFAFPQGVASGDPRSDSVVFWTRVVRDERVTRYDGDPRRRTLPGAPGPVRLTLVVARDRNLHEVVARVPLEALPEYDYTVRAKVRGLHAATSYWYRFVVGHDESPLGRARTAPARGQQPAALRFGWMTCQDWSVNHWAAMDLLAKEELDFVVHLGDYIYETVGAAFQSGAAEPAHGPIRLPDGAVLADGARAATTLADYRTLYRTYRSDRRLQAVHARFPMIATWDDHEFSDDAWQDHQTYTNANVQQTARRRAANQAWVEYMPVDFGDVSFDLSGSSYDNLRIYRDFRFGALLHLVMTDERLYRDDHVVPEPAIAQAQGHDPVNGSDSIGARYFIQQPVLQQFEAARTQQLGRTPSILGPTQTAWWKRTLAGSGAVWKVWGNEVMLSRLWLDLTTLAPPPFNARYVVNGDAWDGYPSHKAELAGWLKQTGVRNVVAITGDLHAFQCGVVRDVPDASGTPVLVDFVAAGISSSSFYSYIRAGASGTPLAALTATPAAFDAVLQQQNPDLVYADHDAQGFATAVVTPTSFVVTYHKVRPLDADGKAPVDPLWSRTRITLLEGTRTPIIERNV